MPRRQTLQPPPARYLVVECLHPDYRDYVGATIETTYLEPQTLELRFNRFLEWVPARLIKGGPPGIPSGREVTIFMLRLRKISGRSRPTCTCEAYPFPHRLGAGLCPGA